MKEYYDLDALKVQFANYIDYRKESANTETIGAAVEEILDFIGYLKKQENSKEEEK